MKNVFLLLVIVLAFFHPVHSSALEVKRPYHFENIQQENLFISDNSQGVTPCFDADLSDKDDDDLNNAVRKKCFVVSNSFSISIVFALQDVVSHFLARPSCYVDFFRLPSSRFSFLKTFRL